MDLSKMYTVPPILFYYFFFNSMLDLFLLGKCPGIIYGLLLLLGMQTQHLFSAKHVPVHACAGFAAVSQAREVFSSAPPNTEQS